MKENSIKNERSSIEEDIILLKDFTEGNFKRDKLENYKGSYKMGYFYYKDIQQAIEHILKELKRFENMYEAEKRIHIVRNEQLARKQQLVIKCNELENENKELKKEIKSWKKYSDEQEENIIEKNNIICNLEFQIEKLQKENEGLKERIREHTLLISPYYVKENFIPVQIIKDFIKKYQKLGDKFYEKFLETNRTDKDLHDVGLACDAKVQVLQELLEGRKI